MTSKEKAEALYLSMHGVSFSMDFSDARKCALICKWNELEVLSKSMPYGLDYLFKRDDIMEQIAHLEEMDLTIYYSNVQGTRLDYDVHG